MLNVQFDRDSPVVPPTAAAERLPPAFGACPRMSPRKGRMLQAYAVMKRAACERP